MDLTKKTTQTEQSTRERLPESEDQKSRRHEHEERLRGMAIEDATDVSRIPNRFRGMRFDDYEIHTRYSNINVHKRMEQVKSDCQDFLKDGTYDTGLLMVGKNGTGKTMLACIILQELIIIDPKNSYGYLYTEAIKIIRNIKETWRTNTIPYQLTEQEAIDRYVRPKVLVIDEIGMQYGSPTEKQFLTEIINDRYNINASTILAGNLTTQEIRNLLGDRIYDRFCEDGKSLVFDWPSYRRKNKQIATK